MRDSRLTRSAGASRNESRNFMRLIIAAGLLLGSVMSPALAQVVAPPSPAAPGPAPKASQTVAAEKNAHAAAVADCEQMWDRETHMTKQEWARTCRRVQDRLRQIQVK